MRAVVSAIKNATTWLGTAEWRRIYVALEYVLMFAGWEPSCDTNSAKDHGRILSLVACRMLIDMTAREDYGRNRFHAIATIFTTQLWTDVIAAAMETWTRLSTLHQKMVIIIWMA